MCVGDMIMCMHIEPSMLVTTVVALCSTACHQKVLELFQTIDVPLGSMASMVHPDPMPMMCFPRRLQP